MEFEICTSKTVTEDVDVRETVSIDVEVDVKLTVKLPDVTEIDVILKDIYWAIPKEESEALEKISSATWHRFLKEFSRNIAIDGEND